MLNGGSEETKGKVSRRWVGVGLNGKEKERPDQ